MAEDGLTLPDTIPLGLLQVIVHKFIHSKKPYFSLVYTNIFSTFYDTVFLDYKCTIQLTLQKQQFLEWLPYTCIYFLINKQLLHAHCLAFKGKKQLELSQHFLENTHRLRGSIKRRLLTFSSSPPFQSHHPHPCPVTHQLLQYLINQTKFIINNSLSTYFST